MLGHCSRAVVGDRGQARAGLFLVGLVGEAVHALAAFGVVAHDTEEDHDGAAAGRGRPRSGRVDRQRLGSDGDPVGAVIRREHGVMVVKAPTPGSGDPKCANWRQYTPPAWALRTATRRTTPTTSPPRRVPDPLDRPWVHPTELRSFVATPEAPTSPPAHASG